MSRFISIANSGDRHWGVGVRLEPGAGGCRGLGVKRASVRICTRGQRTALTLYPGGYGAGWEVVRPGRRAWLCAALELTCTATTDLYEDQDLAPISGMVRTTDLPLTLKIDRSGAIRPWPVSLDPRSNRQAPPRPQAPEAPSPETNDLPGQAARPGHEASASSALSACAPPARPKLAHKLRRLGLRDKSALFHRDLLGSQGFGRVDVCEVWPLCAFVWAVRS